jgi:hypothetical protein
VEQSEVRISGTALVTPEEATESCFRCGGDHPFYSCEFKEYARGNCRKTGHHKKFDSGGQPAVETIPLQRKNIRAVQTPGKAREGECCCAR